jgi:predicted nucleic acid-binding protein
MGSVDLLLDTNVLIKVWRGSTDFDSIIERFSCGVETVVCVEFLQGVNHRQKKKADVFIDKFVFVPFSPDISFKAVQLVREHAHLKGMRLADAPSRQLASNKIFRL